MSFLERFKGSKRNEQGPETISEMQNAILTQAEQWRMEGTPWWLEYSMVKIIKDQKLKGSVYSALLDLEFRGFIDRVMGEKVDDDGPFREVPPMPINIDNLDLSTLIANRVVTRYDRITSGGGNARGRIEIPQRSPVSSPSLVPEVL